ncbi:MAG: hypothetical protein AAB924_01890 [Patescibacteria group bacterium]
MRYSRGDIAKGVLLGLAAGGFVAVSLALPNFPQVLKFFKNDSKERYRIKRAIFSLKNKRLVKTYLKDGQEFMEITENGKKKVLLYNLDEMKIKQDKKWDGFWKVAAFDIPERHRKARMALSRKMKEMGLLSLQKSLFISPFDFSNEIDFIGEVFNVRKYILYFTIKNFSDKNQENFLKNIFEL